MPSIDSVVSCCAHGAARVDRMPCSSFLTSVGFMRLAEPYFPSHALENKAQPGLPGCGSKNRLSGGCVWLMIAGGSGDHTAISGQPYICCPFPRIALAGAVGMAVDAAMKKKVDAANIDKESLTAARDASLYRRCSSATYPPAYMPLPKHGQHVLQAETVTRYKQSMLRQANRHEPAIAAAAHPFFSYRADRFFWTNRSFRLD